MGTGRGLHHSPHYHFILTTTMGGRCDLPNLDLLDPNWTGNMLGLIIYVFITCLYFAFSLGSGFLNFYFVLIATFKAL